MRIVIDMQGAQTESRFRGIGRYTLAFAQAVVRNRGEHEVILALSGLFPDTVESIRASFNGLLPQENIRVWYAPGPVNELHPGNETRREMAELIREAFLVSLQPDIIHISSLFEGYADDAITSISRLESNIQVTVSLYDLIPFINSDHYLKPNPRYAAYYERKMKSLMYARAYLAISAHARAEGIGCLKVPEERVINVSTAISQKFKPVTLSDESTRDRLREFGIERPYVLYTGGADERKNLPRLIEAYAALPRNIRRRHQLLFAGRMPDENITKLKQIAESTGLSEGELTFTGYISDEELILLYNRCKLYVFPSWHEGFGLPALEAMACGAAVIGANSSSLPEVIGLEDALFDPFDVAAITEKIQRALVDKPFLAKLHEHGHEQTKKFSWDLTACRAISEWESLSTSPIFNCYESSGRYEKPLFQELAALAVSANESELLDLSSCLAKNQQTGIERQLFIDISELCQHDAATGVQRVVRSYLKWLLESPPSGFRVEPVFASREHGYRYARCFTGSFLGHSEINLQDEPILWQRGDIFFGLDMQHHIQLAHADFYQRLKHDGVTVKFLVYDLLPIQLDNCFTDSGFKNLHAQWLSMIAASDGAICISRATAMAYEGWIESANVYKSPNFRAIPVHIGADIEGSKPSTGMPSNASKVLESLCQRPTFLCVSTIEPRKGQQQILEAVELLWREDKDVNLVFVGQRGWGVKELSERLIQHREMGGRLFWLQGISDEYLERVYSQSSCLVAASINEGFGLSLIEAAKYGIPIIARDIEVFREVAGDHAFYFHGGSAHELADGLKTWLRLHKSGNHPLSKAMPWLTWQQSAEKLKLALTLDNYPRRQLLVDISELVKHDARSGIQRVVRSILKHWLETPPDGYRVEPIYAANHHGYRYARNFTLQFLGCPADELHDEPIEYATGDLFVGLDLQPQVQVAQRSFYQELRRAGVKVVFTVYDLLCMHMPQFFVPGAKEDFERWLDVVAENDGAICISKAVSDELVDWVAKRSLSRLRPFKIDWFHLGADVNSSMPTNGLPENATNVLSQLQARESFLMVGTVEPRKGHIQVLDTFDLLWSEGEQLNLVIVGKQGWMVETLVRRFRSHPELNNRFFWLDGISDEYLEKVYAASNCLIAASYGEGFGLPLIEAAQHKLPIIARDIPVFREVAGSHAFYFDVQEAKELASVIQQWLLLYRQDKHPVSESLPWNSWKESARQLLESI